MRHIVKKDILLIDALNELAPESSRNTLRTWIKDGRVQVDGREVATPSLALNPGQTIEVTPHKKKQGAITIIFEDFHIVVIEKPTGLLSVATNFETKATAHALLKERYHPRKVLVIHRLDQDTSGVMVFALSPNAYQNLKQELKEHKVSRRYYGIVEGKLEGKGTWTSFLHEDSNYHVHVSHDPTRGEKAITHYEAIHHTKKYTLVHFQLETGKKNQIRVQAAAAGFPIAGDMKYGANESVQRVFLHAAELSFLHPITQKPLLFQAPIPKEFLSLLGVSKIPSLKE